MFWRSLGNSRFTKLSRLCKLNVIGLVTNNLAYIVPRSSTTSQGGKIQIFTLFWRKNKNAKNIFRLIQVQQESCVSMRNSETNKRSEFKGERERERERERGRERRKWLSDPVKKKRQPWLCRTQTRQERVSSTFFVKKSFSANFYFLHFQTTTLEREKC